MDDWLDEFNATSGSGSDSDTSRTPSSYTGVHEELDAEQPHDAIPSTFFPFPSPLPVLPPQPTPAAPSLLSEPSVVTQLLHALLGSPNPLTHVPPRYPSTPHKDTALWAALELFPGLEDLPHHHTPLPPSYLPSMDPLEYLPPSHVYLLRGVVEGLPPGPTWSAVGTTLLHSLAANHTATSSSKSTTSTPRDSGSGPAAAATAAAATAAAATTLTAHLLETLLITASTRAFTPITVRALGGGSNEDMDPSEGRQGMIQSILSTCNRMAWLEWCAACVLGDCGEEGVDAGGGGDSSSSTTPPPLTSPALVALLDGDHPHHHHPLPASSYAHLLHTLLPLLDAALLLGNGPQPSSTTTWAAAGGRVFGPTPRALARALSQGVSTIRSGVTALAAYHGEWVGLHGGGGEEEEGLASFFFSTPTPSASATRGGISSASSSSSSSGKHHPPPRIDPALTLVSLAGWLASLEGALDTLTLLARAAFFTPPPPSPTLPMGVVVEAPYGSPGAGGAVAGSLASSLAWSTLHALPYHASAAIDAVQTHLRVACLVMKEEGDGEGEGEGEGKGGEKLGGEKSEGGVTACLSRALGHMPHPPHSPTLLASALAATLTPYLASLDTFLHGVCARGGEGGIGEWVEGVGALAELPFTPHGAGREGAAMVVHWVCEAVEGAVESVGGLKKGGGGSWSPRREGRFEEEKEGGGSDGEEEEEEERGEEEFSGGGRVVDIHTLEGILSAWEAKLSCSSSTTTITSTAGGGGDGGGGDGGAVDCGGGEFWSPLAPPHFSPTFLRIVSTGNQGGGATANGGAATSSSSSSNSPSGLALALGIKATRALIHNTHAIAIPSSTTNSSSSSLLQLSLGAATASVNEQQRLDKDSSPLLSLSGLSLPPTFLSGLPIFKPLQEVVIDSILALWEETRGGVEGNNTSDLGTPSRSRGDGATSPSTSAALSVSPVSLLSPLSTIFSPPPSRAVGKKEVETALGAAVVVDVAAVRRKQQRRKKPSTTALATALPPLPMARKPLLPPLSFPPQPAATIATRKLSSSSSSVATTSQPHQPLPQVKPVFGAGIAPLPGRRLSAWWAIDAQVDVKKGEKKGDDGAVPPPSLPSTNTSSSSSSLQRHRLRSQRVFQGRGALNISVIKEEEEEDEDEDEDELSSADEDGWAAKFANAEQEDAGSVKVEEDKEVAVVASSSASQSEAAEDKPPTPLLLAAPSLSIPGPSTTTAGSYQDSDEYGSFVGVETEEEDEEEEEEDDSASMDSKGSEKAELRPKAHQKHLQHLSEGVDGGPFDQWEGAAAAWHYLSAAATAGKGGLRGGARGLDATLISAAAGEASVVRRREGERGSSLGSANEWRALGSIMMSSTSSSSSHSSMGPSAIITSSSSSSITISGGRPTTLACEPLAVSLMHRTLLGPLEAQSTLLSRLLAAQLLHPQVGDFMRHVWSIRAVILGEQGQAVGPFWERVFGALGVGGEATSLFPPSPTPSSTPGGGQFALLPPRNANTYTQGPAAAGGGGAGTAAGLHGEGGDAARSSSQLTAWLRASLSTPGPHLSPTSASPYHLNPAAFSVAFSGLPTLSPSILVSTGMRLTYNPYLGGSSAAGIVASATNTTSFSSPPLPALLLTPPILHRYGCVGGVMGGLRLAVSGAQTLAHVARHVEEGVLGGLGALAPPGLPPTLGRAWLGGLACTARVRSLALGVLGRVWGSVSQGVLEAPWAGLVRAVASASSSSIEGVRAAHEQYLGVIERVTLLGEGQGVAKSRLAGLLARAGAVESASYRYYAVLLAAVDSVVGLAEEGAEAREVLQLGGGGNHSGGGGGAYRGHPKNHTGRRRHSLPVDLHVLAHAAEVGLQVHRAFMHVESIGRALEREVAAFERSGAV